MMEIFKQAWKAYVDDTPERVRIIDYFLSFLVLTGGVQFLYMLLVGSFPYNSFLSGFISCVGTFVLSGWPTHGSLLLIIFCNAVFVI